MVVPFYQCIARPPSIDGTQHLLSDHLAAVAESWGDPRGDPPSRLRFLAGLLHDAGKAREPWQYYIRHVGERGVKSVNHSPLGSALFVYCACKLLDAWHVAGNELRDLHSLTISLAYDIYDHHGPLSDFDVEPPWEDTLDPEHFLECDLRGMAEFINQYFSEIMSDLGEITFWLAEFEDTWGRWVAKAHGYVQRMIDSQNGRFTAAAERCIRTRTAGLIAADRYHASSLTPDVLDCASAAKALSRLQEYCESRKLAIERLGKGALDICELRQRLQRECVRRYQEDPDEGFYTLLLPTGLGKTLSSMRVALTACASGRCHRIIYVAPYLAILSQATKEINAATGLDVLQHHHLSALYDESIDSLVLESWQAPVVTTTFNQLFRALFPSRAQQTLRLKGLDGAFVIIDEPQIIDGAVWNLFLKMLEAASNQCGMQVLFSTATLPPLEFGLDREAVPLAPMIKAPERYKVLVIDGYLDEEGIAELAVEEAKKAGSVAVILNTIKDSANVYSLIRGRVPSDMKCYNISGCMTPLHKSRRITEISEQIKSSARVITVSTQVLECGVDLSFRTILRARPVIPSIAQAAGRGNRHAEGEIAYVKIFQFLQSGEKDTRQFVYRDKIAREETDLCIDAHTEWTEPETRGIVDEYYRRLLSRNTNTALLDALVEAACGTWSAIEGRQPFGPEYPHVDLFVPYGEEYLSPRLVDLLYQYAPHGCEELYELYLDRRFRAKLDFAQRKRFMALLQHFIVSLDEKSARGIVQREEDVSIGRIIDKNLYSEDTGLAHLLGRQDENEIMLDFL